MHRLTKIAIGIFATLIIVVAIAVVVIVTLDPNDYKDWVAERFTEQTGRNLSLDGNIELTLYPWFGLNLGQVSISNREGFGSEPMLQADTINFRARLLPALRQQYEIDTVQLYGARVSLVVNEDGENNWNDLLSGTEEGSEQDSSSDAGSSGGLPLSNVILGGVDIQDAGLVYEDRSTGVRYEINELTLSTDELVYGAPIDLTSTMQVVASQPQLDAQIVVNGTLNYDLDNENYQLAPLAVEADLSGDNLPGGSAAISLTSELDLDLADDTLTISNLDLNGLNTRLLATITGSDFTTGNPTYQAEVSLAGNDLAVPFRVAEIESLANQLEALDDRAFNVSTTTSLSPTQDEINISSLSAELLGANLEGEFLVSGVQSEQPVVRGNVNASGPDLPLLVEVLGQLSGGADSILGQMSDSLVQADDENFSVTAEFNADMQAGNVSVTTLDAELLGATITGNLQGSDVQSEAPVLTGNLSAEGPDLPLLLRLAGQVQGGDQSFLYQLGSNFGENEGRAFVASAQFDADMESGNIEIPQLNATGLGLQLDGNLSAQNINDSNGTVSGSIRLDGQNLQPFFAALNQSGMGETVQSLTVDVQLSGTRENMSISPLRSSMVVSGPQIPNSPVTIELNAATQVDLEQETLSVDSFSLSGLGLDATGSFNAENLFEEIEFDGQLLLADFNLREFMEQMDMAVPDTQDVTVLQRVGVSTAFTGTTESIALANLDLAIDDTNISGNLAINDISSQAVEFDLSVDQLDIDRYLAPESNQSSEQASPSATEVPIDEIRNFVAQGTVRAGAFAVSGLEFSDLSFTINAADGVVDLAPLSANLYQGSFAGEIHLSTAEEIPVASVEADLQQVNLAPFLQDLLDATYLTGIGNVQLAMNTSGNDTDAMLGNLNGNGNISLVDGVLSGVDVASVLGQLETMIRSRRVGDLQRGQQTQFDTFSGSFAINQGVVSTNDLVILSPGFEVTGRGTLLNLNDDTIGFDLVTSVDESTATRNDQEYDIGGYSLPIACTGTMDSPRCLPDAGEILRAALAREVQDRVGGLLDRALGIDRPDPDDPDALEADPNQDDQTQPETEPEDIRDQIINRALDRIFN